MEPSILADLVLVGLSQGCLYGAVAVGYSVVYGILRVINFSHGEVYASSAYVGYVLIAHQGTGLGTAMICSAVFAALMMWFVESNLLRRVGGRKEALLLAHIGLSVVIRALLSLLFGEHFTSIRQHLHAPSKLDIGGVQLNSFYLVLMATAATLALALWFLIAKTSFGRILRAVVEDREAAAALGFGSAGVVTRAYVLGAACAGFIAPVGGALTELTPQMGFMLGVKAFIASALGGIGKPLGAMGAGLVLGIGEAFVGGLFGSQFREPFAFLLLIVLLAAFPHGLASGLAPTGERVH